MKTRKYWLRFATLTVTILAALATAAGVFASEGAPDGNQQQATPGAGTSAGLNANSVLYLPVVSSMQAPAPSAPQSYYIQNNDPSVMWSLGCSLGEHDQQTPGKQDSLVILNFGQMWTQSGTPGVYSYGDWVSMGGLQDAVKSYVEGYYQCSGSDDTSYLTLGIGTNNYGTFGTGSSSQSVLSENAYAYGQRWATLVNAVNTWSAQKGYYQQVFVTGAIDIEWGGTYWNSARVTRSWVDGFKNNSGLIYFNFGACAGCWTSNAKDWSYDYPFTDAWTTDDVWYVSWGSVAGNAVPEIYSNNGTLARQWQAISKYAAQYKGGRIDFTGPMTQYQACLQQWDPVTKKGDSSCETLDNTPEEGWQQLYDALNADKDTAQSLDYVTDIGWQEN